MLSIISAVLPVVVAIGVGVLCRHFAMLDADGARRLNRLVYWILFPCLLVVKLGTSEVLRGGEAGPPAVPWLPLAVIASAILLSVTLLALAGRSAGSARLGSLLSLAYRSNAAFIGLPIIELLKRNQVVGAHEETLYLLVLASAVPIFNLVSVIGFVLPRHGFGWAAIRSSLIGLLRNPIIWGCLLGLLASQLPAGIHGHLEDGMVGNTLWLLGRPAIPLALIAAGASLRIDELTDIPGVAWLATGWKLLAMPALALLLAWLFGADQHQQAVLLVLAVCPSAVAIVPMASELGGDVRVAATGVVLSTLLAPLSMVTWLFLVIA